MSKLIEIPLNSGMDQGVDRVLLGQDKLSLVQNARLTRDGRLEVRPPFETLGTATLSTGTLVAYDAANYSGRLVVLGDQTNSDRATDLFELLPDGRWRGTSGDDITVTTGRRLPQLTDLRSVGSLPDQQQAVSHVRLAAGGGYVCAIINYSQSPTTVTVHVFRPDTDQTILFETLALSWADVCYAGTDFWIVGVDANDDAAFTNFDPTTDESLPSLTVDTALASVNDLAACSFGTGWAYAYSHAGGVGAKTKTSAGAAGVTIAVTATASDACAIAGNTAGTFLSVANRVTATGSITLNTYTSAGALQAGPTSVIASTTIIRVGLSISGTSSSVRVQGAFLTDTQSVEVAQSNHAQTLSNLYHDARLTGASAQVSGRHFATVVDREANSQDVGTHHIVDLTSEIPQAFLQPQLANVATVDRNRISKAAFEGTKLYTAITTSFLDNGLAGRRAKFFIYEAETAGTGRRQMVQVGGELLIAGGLPLTYDGRTLAEQGFPERPCIVSATQGTAGSLTPLGVYRVVPVWEVFDSKGRLLRSQAGEVEAVTLTGANDDILWGVTTPHSLRRHPAFADQQLTVRVSLYRTEAGEGVFFLDVQTVIAPPLDDPAEYVTLTSSQSDANLIDNAILYTQSQAAIDNVAPSPYRYAWPARERAFIGGLPEPEAWQFSKLLFPGEPVEWAFNGRLGFSGRVGQEITAVASFETTSLVWTESDVWQIPGRGPEHNGTGEFDPSSPIAVPGGTYNWKSVIVAPPGAFYQMMPDRLMVLTRGGEVQWIGSPIQDTLEAFPVITGAVFVRQLDQVAFACNNEAGSSGVFLIYDLTNNQWYVDTVGEAIQSVSELDGRLVYLSGGLVKRQYLSVATSAGTVPTLVFETPCYRFFSALGYGDLIKVGLLGTYSGDCTVALEISYDDGKTYGAPDSFAVTAAAMTNPVTGAALASGDPITLIWTPNKMQTDRFRLRVTMSGATSTGGCRFHALSLEVDGVEFTTRQPAGNQR